MNLEIIGKNIDSIRIARHMSRTELARQMGKTPSFVSHHINTGNVTIQNLAKYAECLGCTIADLTEGTTDPTAFEIPDGIYGRYPWNLAAAVGNIKEEDAYLLYDIYIPALKESVDKGLTDREQQVIRMRFKHHMTLEAVGRELCITRERVRQVEAKALRKLRHPRHWRHWQLDTMERYIAAEEKAARYELECMHLQSLIQKQAEEPEPEEKPILGEIGIDEMELSVRSYNCLRRGGYRTVADLVGKTYADLAKVRNLGRKSVEEVVKKAREYGIEIEM